MMGKQDNQIQIVILDMDAMIPKDLIVSHINSTPRESLGEKTPYETMKKRTC